MKTISKATQRKGHPGMYAIDCEMVSGQGLILSLIHWASKETYHFFRVTLTKIYPIKINHKKESFACVKKEKNAVKSQKVIFRKWQKMLTEQAPWRQPIQNIQ